MTFREIVRGLRAFSPDAMAALVSAAPNLGDEELAHLTQALSDSGDSLRWADQASDLVSTGGPGSLSTILGPLNLAALGHLVPSLAVPGRPAGGIDALATVPGYRFSLEALEVRDIIARCGYAHFIAGDRFAPLDAALFKFRQKNNAQDSPPLVIASLLSKKLATGVTGVGVDVRVAPFGNFGSNFEQARINALRLKRVATLVGINASCWLTDTRIPYQPWIGRGETLVALRIALHDEMDQLLEQHASDCWRMARSVDASSRSRPSSVELAYVFRAHLSAQGSTFSAFLERAASVEHAERTLLAANSSGVLDLHIENIRTVLVRIQSSSEGASREFQDPVGVKLLRSSGDEVQKGEPILAVRGDRGYFDGVREEQAPLFSVISLDQASSRDLRRRPSEPVAETET